MFVFNLTANIYIRANLGNDIYQKVQTREEKIETPREIAKRLSDRYHPLSEAELDAFASIIEPMQAEKGEIVLRDGQIDRHLYYVRKGILRQFYYKGNRDITEEFNCEEQIAVCIASAFRREPTSLLIEALEPTRYYRISLEGWKELMKSSVALNQLYQKFLEEILIESQNKADSWRFETARMRYERFQRDYPEAAKRASVNHIASYLLMTPESLSRVRSGVL